MELQNAGSKFLQVVGICDKNGVNFISAKSDEPLVVWLTWFCQFALLTNMLVEGTWWRHTFHFMEIHFQKAMARLHSSFREGLIHTAVQHPLTMLLVTLREDRHAL